MSDPSGWKQFIDGDVLPADEIRGYLQQGVLVFDNTSHRDSTLVGAVREGMVAYVKDTDAVSYYDGATWNVITGQIAFASIAARDAAIPTPTEGRYAYTTDESRLWIYSSGAWAAINAPGFANFSNAATGTYTSGASYKYVTFTGTGTLTVTASGLADVVVVGGGGGALMSGGGGGQHVETSIYLVAGNYTCTVAGGGAAGVAGSVSATNGGKSSMVGTGVNLVAIGGGSGSDNNDLNRQAGNGASGGGVHNVYTYNGILFGQGLVHFNGGVNSSTLFGGGGGAGGVGGNGGGTGGAGGAGIASSITGTSVGRAGGGGGGANGTGGTASSGGGAGGNTGAAGTSGSANTGGGGGGGGWIGVGPGAGGSGVVIVRVRTN